MYLFTLLHTKQMTYHTPCIYTYSIQTLIRHTPDQLPPTLAPV